MHGCENSKKIRRMLSVPSSVNTRRVIAAVDYSDAARTSKDVRKINIGDCALFKPPQESPPFIGIIRSLGPDKETNLQLGVTWLYRPADIQLPKGVAIEAAPNEVFYSFHRDEIPAASLLHPCKVAFLPKGVELPSGVSSFFCRRVYDTTNKRLWWLTDKDFINGRQEEVDKLLQKTQQDMRATVQPQGVRSPKPMNSPRSSQLKHSPDSVQNSAAAFASHSKGKKREQSDNGSEIVKRERYSKADDGDSSVLSSDVLLKSEIAKITEKGGLVDSKAVERLVQLMQSDKVEKRLDIPCRSLLVAVLAATNKDDCLNRFVQLRGLPVLDEWLQEVHKGKVRDSSSPRDHDKSVMDFLLTLLHALERLPVNLYALQMCNIGKSVNHLRSHRNLDIQKKARSLVDIWKKRVEAEMNINDSRSATSHGVSWPGRVRNDNGITRRSSASDAAIKNSPSQLSSSKSAPAKSIDGEVAKCASASPTIVKQPCSSAYTSANMKEAHLKISVTNSSSELPLSAIKDEKSSSSSHSQTNSQCSSDHVKSLGPAVKEDARSSNSGSSLNNSSGSASRHRKAANDRKGVAASTIHLEGGSMKSSSLTRISASEKFSQPSSCGKASDLAVADSNNHKLIVKISNRGRSTAQNVHGGCLDDLSSMNSRTSSPVVPEKFGQSERSSKEKSGGYPNNTMSDVITESWQSNDLKDRAAVCDEADGSPSEALDSGNCQTGGETRKLTHDEKAVSVPNVESNSRKLQDSSLSSINALIESCVEYSEANLPMSAGDIVGMNLLASVAAGEITKSPVQSPERSTSVAEESCQDYSARSKPNGDILVSLGEPSVEARKQKLTCASVHDGDKDDQPRLHGKDFVSSGNSCLRTDEKRDVSEPPPTMSPTSAAGSEASDKAQESKPAIRNDIHVWTPQGVSTLDAKVKISDGSVVEENHERSVAAGPVSSADVDENNVPKERHESKVVMKKRSSTMASKECMGRNEKGGVSSCINDLLPGQFNDFKDDDIDVGGGSILNQGANEKVKLEKDEKVKLEKGDLPLHKKEVSVLDSGACDHNIKNNEVDLMDKDTTVAPATKINSYSPALDNDVVSDSNDSVLPACEGEVAVDKHHCSVKVSSPAMEDKKVEFDLNEGFDGDDNKDEDLPCTVSRGRLNCQLPSFSVASTSVGLPASVTVASAAKGPFMPPEDLLRNKAELGWRGSAATSAFRPAEPRKVSENPPGVNNEQISDVNNEKQGRARFEIDLNVADERTIDDMDCQVNNFQTSKRPEFETSDGPTGVASRRNGGGLDLDLNRVDEAPDLAQPLPPIHRFEMPLQPIRLSSSSAPANCASGRRDFDLNNGPTADEFNVDSLPFNKHLRSNIYSQPSVGLRINSAEMGTLNPWYTAGTAYSTIPIPAGLPDRVQSFPIADTSGVPPRMWVGPAEAMPFNPDMYKGPVLSSPAVPFPSAQYQYPVFPLGTSFPLPSSSLQGGSTAFMDLSSGGRFCIPAVGSQLLGSALSVPSQYPRPYVVSVSDVGSGVAVDNAQKWGRQGLDLNAGPDSEPIMSRPMPSLGPLALTDEQSRLYTMAGAMKRKEPDGGWDMDRLSYKQPSWQ